MPYMKKNKVTATKKCGRCGVRHPFGELVQEDTPRGRRWHCNKCRQGILSIFRSQSQVGGKS